MDHHPLPFSLPHSHPPSTYLSPSHINVVIWIATNQVFSSTLNKLLIIKYYHALWYCHSIKQTSKPESKSKPYKIHKVPLITAYAYERNPLPLSLSLYFFMAFFFFFPPFHLRGARLSCNFILSICCPSVFYNKCLLQFVLLSLITINKLFNVTIYDDKTLQNDDAETNTNSI